MVRDAILASPPIWTPPFTPMEMFVKALNCSPLNFDSAILTNPESCTPCMFRATLEIPASCKPRILPPIMFIPNAACTPSTRPLPAVNSPAMLTPFSFLSVILLIPPICSPCSVSVAANIPRLKLRHLSESGVLCPMPKPQFLKWRWYVCPFVCAYVESVVTKNRSAITHILSPILMQRDCIFCLIH